MGRYGHRLIVFGGEYSDDIQLNDLNVLDLGTYMAERICVCADGVRITVSRDHEVEPEGDH
jgi:hypothetical protein